MRHFKKIQVKKECKNIKRKVKSVELANLLISKEKMNYKCFDELKRLLKTDDKFRETIKMGYIHGKVYGFDNELWQKISEQNVRRINSFEDVFKDGANIGYCTVSSKQLSYSFEQCDICGGTLPILKGTRNCEDGRHTWIQCENEIIDTSLMLIIDKSYAERIGYIEENRYDPNIDPIYLATKKFTNDKSFKENRKKVKR